MERKIARDIDELIEIWINDVNFEVEDDGARGNLFADDYDFKNIDVDFQLYLPLDRKALEYMQSYINQNIEFLRFRNCKFFKNVYIGVANSGLEFSAKCNFKATLRCYGSSKNISIHDSTIHELNFQNAIFGSLNDGNGKVRFRECNLFTVNFRNSTFNELADFWNCTFNEPTTFFKTDFNSTAVFSSATFEKNVLFTYTLFGGKAIFGRAKFKEGLDFSQAIISGDLQLFDLNFTMENYKTEYTGSDNRKFQNLIQFEHKIPLINKVVTFQILKNQFAKQGNHIDEIEMRKEEKKAYEQLTQYRTFDTDWQIGTRADRFILWLNRKSNYYRTNFWRGIVFTAFVATLFLALTILTTNEFWGRLCFYCEFEWEVMGFVVKLFINFLNPAHSMDYIDRLNPIWGVPYVFDFLGRIAVGYGIYQTVQAFRKFR